jgi:hypothetical protein
MNCRSPVVGDRSRCSALERLSILHQYHTSCMSAGGLTRDQSSDLSSSDLTTGPPVRVADHVVYLRLVEQQRNDIRATQGRSDVQWSLSSGVDSTEGGREMAEDDLDCRIYDHV